MLCPIVKYSLKDLRVNRIMQSFDRSVRCTHRISYKHGTWVLFGGAGAVVWELIDHSRDNEMINTSDSNLGDLETQLFDEAKKESITKSMIYPSHNRITWFWLYSKRICYLFFNFLPLLIIFPLIYYNFNIISKEYWLELLKIKFGTGGVTFIKLAQWISMRPDIFDDEVCQSLAKLRVDSPCHSYSDTCKIIKDSFGKDISEIFETFYMSPVASGSIAQIHKGSICIDDTNGSNSNNCIDVAVKVRHPNIVEDIIIDVDILYTLSRIVSLNVPMYQDSFIKYLTSQIDLRTESKHLNMFNSNFESKNSNNGVTFPKPIKGFVAQACIVETWENGVSLSDLTNDNIRNKLSINRRFNIAKQCYDIFMNMLLRDNFVHGDCHSGNILVRSDELNQVVFLDAGLAASLSKQGSKRIGLLMGYIARGKSYDAANVFFQWCNVDVDEKKRQQKKESFINSLSRTIDKHLKWQDYHGKPVDTPHIPNVGNLLHDVLLLTHKEGIVLDSQFCAIIASLGVIEGLIKQIYPPADFIKWGIPYLVRNGIYS